MLRYLRLLIAAIGLIVIIVFAVGNRGAVSISFFPLPISPIELPLSLVFMLGILIGAIVGGVALWLSTGNMRAEYNQLRRRDRAIRHLEKTKEQQEVAEAAMQSAQRSQAATISQPVQRETMAALPNPSR